MTPSHHAVLALLFLVLGSCVGSFLNVCMYRIARGLSVLYPRSSCPRCGAAIRLWDNVPVLGWLILLGKCRHCRLPISARYPIVELTVGLLFAGSYLAEAALAPGDLWDAIGPVGMLLLTLLSWTLIVLVVVGAAMSREARNQFKAPEAPARHPKVTEDAGLV